MQTSTKKNQKSQQQSTNKNKKKRKVNTNRQKTVQRVRVNEPLLQKARLRAERFHLSPCSEKYLKALMDPYLLEGGQACIPDVLDSPSGKFLCVSRGGFTIGTQGIGFIFVSPKSSASDNETIILTGATFAGSAVPASTATVGVIRTNFEQHPYPAASLSTSGVTARVVGCGIRVRYTGTTLNASGRIIPYRKSAQGATVATHGASQFLSKPEVRTMTCNRKWKSVTYLPITSSDYIYAVDSYPVSSAFVNADLGFYIDGAIPGNGFEWEIYQHLEYISSDGTIVPSNVTPSHSDAPGLSAIRNVVEGSLPVGDAKGALDQAWDRLTNLTPEEMSHVYNVASNFGSLALGWK